MSGIQTNTVNITDTADTLQALAN